MLLAWFAALAAAGLYAAAVTLQAIEARRAPAALQMRPALFGFLLRRRLWVLGTALGLVGWPLQALALAFAPLAVVQPILALSVVGLLIAGHRVLGEPIHRRSLLAGGSVMGGIALLAATAPLHGGAGNGALLGLVLAILGVLAVAPLAVLRFRAAPALVLASAAGVAYVLVALSTTLLDSAIGRGAWWKAAIWLAFSGVGAAVGVLTEMSALRVARATVVGPIIFALETVVPPLLSPVVGQHLGTDAVTLAVDLGGLALVGLGVTVLARSSSVAELIETSS